MAEARGIEVFGRGATVVETGVEPVRRGPWLGILSILLGVLVASATALGVLSMAGGDAEGARWWAYAAIGGGILGAVCGVTAMVTRRGTATGFAGLLVSLLANPWILTRLLEAAASLGA